MSATTAALRELGHQPEPMSRAIRRKCLDCSGGSKAEVRDCLVRKCALFPFRMGKSPWRAPLSQAGRERRRQHLADLKTARENTGENVSGARRGTNGQSKAAPGNDPEILAEDDDQVLEAQALQRGDYS